MPRKFLSVKPYYKAEYGNRIRPVLDKLYEASRDNKSLPAQKLNLSAFGGYRLTTVRQMVFQSWQWLADKDHPKYRELRKEFLVKVQRDGIIIQRKLPSTFDEQIIDHASNDSVDLLSKLNDWIDDDDEREPLVLSGGDMTEVIATIAGLKTVRWQKAGNVYTFYKV